MQERLETIARNYIDISKAREMLGKIAWKATDNSNWSIMEGRTKDKSNKFEILLVDSWVSPVDIWVSPSDSWASPVDSWVSPVESWVSPVDSWVEYQL